MPVEFEIITGDEHQIDALYSLLKRRNHAISHQSMPSFDDHQAFVKNHPYRVWFLVTSAAGYVGSVYLTDQNTIGINLLDECIEALIPFIIHEIKSTYKPLSAMKSVRAGCFSVNVAPSNTTLRSALESYGCCISQVSYKL